MHKREERRKPMIVTLIHLLSLSYYIHNVYQKHDVLFIIMLMIAISIGIILIITEFWKISVHAAGFGGVMGTLFYLYSYENTINLPLLLSFILITILLMLSRVVLNAHNYAQLIIGFLLTFTLSFYSSLIFIGR